MLRSRCAFSVVSLWTGVWSLCGCSNQTTAQFYAVPCIGEKDYEFEPELKGATPRPVPTELRKGPYGRGQRAFMWTMLVVGTLLALCGQLPFVQLWGLFFVPLKYLTWIGLAAVAMAAAAFVGGLLDRGPYRYVQEGIPFVARIRDLTLEPTEVANGSPTGWRYMALVEYQDPENGEVVTRETRTKEISDLLIGGYTVSYRVGDYATAVYLLRELKVDRFVRFELFAPVGTGVRPRQQYSILWLPFSR